MVMTNVIAAVAEVTFVVCSGLVLAVAAAAVAAVAHVNLKKAQILPFLKDLLG